MGSIQTVLDAGSNEATKAAGQETSSVEDSSTGSELSTGIPTREKKECSREIRPVPNQYRFINACLGLCLRFHETKEESRDNQAIEVVYKSCASGDNTPKSHADRLFSSQ